MDKSTVKSKTPQKRYHPIIRTKNNINPKPATLTKSKQDEDVGTKQKERNKTLKTFTTSRIPKIEKLKLGKPKNKVTLNLEGLKDSKDDPEQPKGDLLKLRQLNSGSFDKKNFIWNSSNDDLEKILNVSNVSVLSGMKLSQKEVDEFNYWKSAPEMVKPPWIQNLYNMRNSWSEEMVGLDLANKKKDGRNSQKQKDPGPMISVSNQRPTTSPDFNIEPGTNQKYIDIYNWLRNVRIPDKADRSSTVSSVITDLTSSRASDQADELKQKTIKEESDHSDKRQRSPSRVRKVNLKAGALIPVVPVKSPCEYVYLTTEQNSKLLKSMKKPAGNIDTVAWECDMSTALGTKEEKVFTFCMVNKSTWNRIFHGVDLRSKVTKPWEVRLFEPLGRVIKKYPEKLIIKESCYVGKIVGKPKKPLPKEPRTEEEDREETVEEKEAECEKTLVDVGAVEQTNITTGRFIARSLMMFGISATVVSFAVFGLPSTLLSLIFS